MPKFTVERSYWLPCYVQITLNAKTPEEAARLAMDEEAHTWDHAVMGYEASEAVGITGIWAGDTAYHGDALPIPDELAIPARARPLDREEKQAVDDLRRIACAFIGYDGGLMRASLEGERLARKALRLTEGLRSQ